MPKEGWVWLTLNDGARRRARDQGSHEESGDGREHGDAAVDGV